jgi:hypothetical protein
MAQEAAAATAEVAVKMMPTMVSWTVAAMTVAAAPVKPEAAMTARTEATSTSELAVGVVMTMACLDGIGRCEDEESGVVDDKYGKGSAIEDRGVDSCCNGSSRATSSFLTFAEATMATEMATMEELVSAAKPAVEVETAAETAAGE